MVNKYKNLQNKKKNTRQINKYFLRKKTSFFKGILHIQSTRNNLILSLTDLNGNVIFNSSSGILGITGHRRRLFSNKLKVIETMLNFIKKAGIRKLSINFKGFGPDREFICRNLKKTNILISNIKDFESNPHNGCRLSKPRRL